MRGEEGSPEQAHESEMELLHLPSRGDVVRHRETGELGVADLMGWMEPEDHPDAILPTQMCVSWLGDGYQDPDDVVEVHQVELRERLLCPSDGVRLASPGAGPSLIGTVEEIEVTVDLSVRLMAAQC